jgi:hypothetical protein
MKRKIIIGLLLAALLVPAVASAHHGGISLAFGPGTPIDTASPLTLPEGGLVLSGRFEYAKWREFTFADPDNKDAFSFYTLGVSYGIRPYLTTGVFIPYSIKRQDTLGTNRGLGDVSFTLQLGFNHNPSKGFSLNAAEDTAASLEEIKKTYFALYGGFTLPTGESKKELGGEIDRGMQAGFRSPTFTLGLSAGRHVAGSLSMAADTSYQLFTQKDNFKFGNEWRLNVAAIYELYGRSEALLSKIDAILELNLLNIARDEEGGKRQRATGGTILYVSPGLRFTAPKIKGASLGILFKFPAWKDLNEKDEQQGSEGLEDYRAIATLSFFF